MNEVILDTETTGLSPAGGDKIIEIACIETKDLIPTKNFFYKLINPEREISEDAFKIHGYTYDQLKKEKKFKDIADELINFIKNKKLIIHNAPFDISFLNHELKLVQKPIIDIKNVIDTLELAREKFPGTSNSLDALCKRFNIDLSRRTKHNALLDCELLREVYINLLDVKEPKFKLSTNDIEMNIDRTKDYNKTIIKVSDTELSKHKIFIKSELKKNFY